MHSNLILEYLINLENKITKIEHKLSYIGESALRTENRFNQMILDMQVKNIKESIDKQLHKEITDTERMDFIESLLDGSEIKIVNSFPALPDGGIKCSCCRSINFYKEDQLISSDDTFRMAIDAAMRVEG